MQRFEPRRTQVCCKRILQVILGAGYGTPVDMWSLGCIVAELVTGRPLFTGEDEGDQLASQMEYLGMPPNRILSQSRRAAQFISTSTGRPRYCSVLTTTNEASPSGAVQLTGSTNRSGVYRGPPGSRNLTSSLLDINGRQSDTVNRRYQVSCELARLFIIV
jgi:dual specificity tyrosine-phosphorylation-regulated kinase 2/3/4